MNTAQPLARLIHAVRHLAERANQRARILTSFYTIISQAKHPAATPEIISARTTSSRALRAANRAARLTLTLARHYNPNDTPRPKPSPNQ